MEEKGQLYPIDYSENLNQSESDEMSEDSLLIDPNKSQSSMDFTQEANSNKMKSQQMLSNQ